MLNVKNILKLNNIFLVSIFLVACATPYQKNGLGGGYSEMRLSQDTYLVSFRGNGFTSSDKVNQYLLYRASELSLQNGYNYFLILNANQQNVGYIGRTPITVTNGSYSNFNGSANQFGWNASGYTTGESVISGGETYSVNKYKTNALIKMLKNNKKYPFALDAKIILKNRNQ